MVYLDTNIVIRLKSGEIASLSDKVKDALEKEELFISPLVILELEYLYECKKVLQKANATLHELQEKIGLLVCKEPLIDIVQESLKIKWTRDPFDRLIVAQAKLKNSVLLTKDATILKNYSKAVW